MRESTLDDAAAIVSHSLSSRERGIYANTSRAGEL
jgi:hypothetical protein